MPSRWLRTGPSKLKKCSERRTDSCGPETDGCCAVISCKYCLTWEGYEGTDYGTAEFTGTAWTGTVGGAEFVGYWEKDEYGTCEFVVIFDGEEVYRKSCYEGQSCRDSSDSVEASIGYETGTLRWDKFEPRPLPTVVDYETGCRTHFCGDCHCTCKTLCVEVSEVVYTDFVDTYSGELTDTTYDDCEGPVWEGTVGSFTISLALGRDDYGNCIVTPTVNGEEQDAISVSGCSDLSGTVPLYDGSSFTFRCKECEECGPDVGDCICGRSLGRTLRLVWASGNGTHGSVSRTFDLTYGIHNEPTISCSPFSPAPFPAWRGSQSGEYPIPQGGTAANGLEVIIPCGCTLAQALYYRWTGGERPDFWVQSAFLEISCDCPAILDGGSMTEYDLWGHQVGDVVIYELESNCE